MAPSLSFELLSGKLRRFQKDPLGTLSRKVRYSFEPFCGWLRKGYEQVRFRWPVYDLCSWALNKTPKELYQIEKTNIALDTLQQQIIHQLQETGIAVIHFDDLFSDKRFDSLQQVAEKLIENPSSAARIGAIESGAKKAEEFKYYLVTPWGGIPAFDHEDEFLKFSLSDEILEII